MHVTVTNLVGEIRKRTEDALRQGAPAVLCPELAGDQAAHELPLAAFVTPDTPGSAFQSSNDLFCTVIGPGDAWVGIEFNILLPIPGQTQHKVT